MSNKLAHSKKKPGQGHSRQSTEGKKVLLIILAATMILILILFAVSS